jgi:hypothetical protein
MPGHVTTIAVTPRSVPLHRASRDATEVKP